MDPLPLTTKIIMGEFRASSQGGEPRSEHAIQLTAQRRSIQDQNLEILDYVKVELKKARQLVAQRRSLQEQYLEALDYVEEELEIALELNAQRRNLLEQNLGILDSWSGGGVHHL